MPWCKRLKNRWADERGVVVVWVALLLPLLLGLAAFTVDISAWYEEHRQLQTAVDAAALAGARDLPGQPLDGRHRRPELRIEKRVRRHDELDHAL